LIKQGAKLVENAEDILEEIGLGHKPEKSASLPENKTPDLDASERMIYEFLGDYPQHIDEIVRQLGMDPGEALGILMRLELSGLVKQLPGKMFVTA
jgi:DNA processing protein